MTSEAQLNRCSLSELAALARPSAVKLAEACLARIAEREARSARRGVRLEESTHSSLMFAS